MTGSSESRLRLKRALVEVVVIVGSILLAFWIDAAWDRRLESEQRIELMRAIRADLVGTRAALSEVVPTIEASTERTRTYMEVLRDERPISLDSLSYLFDATFDGFILQPPLSSYDGAINSGRLSSIATPELRESLTEFDVARAVWREHFATLYDTHYLGPTWELRQVIGSQSVIRQPSRAPPAFRLGDRDLRDVVSSRAAYAAAEVHGIIYQNIQFALEAMDEAASRAIAILDDELAR